MVSPGKWAKGYEPADEDFVDASEGEELTGPVLTFGGRTPGGRRDDAPIVSRGGGGRGGGEGGPGGVGGRDLSRASIADLRREVAQYGIVPKNVYPTEAMYRKVLLNAIEAAGKSEYQSIPGMESGLNRRRGLKRKHDRRHWVYDRYGRRMSIWSNISDFYHDKIKNPLKKVGVVVGTVGTIVAPMLPPQYRAPVMIGSTLINAAAGNVPPPPPDQEEEGFVEEQQ